LKLFSEIKRRQVIQGAIAYAIAGWLLIQLAIALEASLELPPYVDRWVTIGVIGGFPVAMLLAWLFDIRLSGIRFTPEAKQTVQPSEAEDQINIPPPKHSIAILPFADMSAEGDQEYFGDGIAEEILNALVKVTPLKVTGRTSSFSFKGKSDDIKAIGAALHVAHVLEGSVRRHGDKVRITAQLIKANDGYHVWSETYDGDLRDIFDLQDRIAKTIVEELEILLDADELRLASALTKNLDAYEAFLKGRERYILKDGILSDAIENFEDAVELDPEFTEAWAHLATAHFVILEHDVVPDPQAHIAAGGAAGQKAIELDPENPMTLTALANIQIMDGDFGQSLETRERAYELAPNNSEKKYDYGHAFLSIGQIEAGRRLMTESLQEDPLSAARYSGVGFADWAAGDLEAAEKTFLKSFNLGYWAGFVNYVWLCANTGQVSTALTFIDQNIDTVADQANSHLGSPIAVKIYIEGALKKRKWARWLLSMHSKKRYKKPNAQRSAAGTVPFLYYADAGSFIDAMLSRPHPYNCAPLAQLWADTDEAKAIRTHPEFPKMAEKMGLVRAWQKYGWPKRVQPKPGTDGSNGQFTCT
jgi:TolB-like protein/cytochrome c-type biogenesis protein CcmH/NrfG